ncbi:hypothetical protein, conserved [Entamoeba dispar SAW760]|uniref:Protein Abitram n=1 Tax=Entamoeba dispar (strain ATCC PRA-260 / SAW760) TaxID=370354 RepID=B0EDK9_ENTDS|nr:uncharacterized protein EDI_064850 [Entamoeba dispar SAW760]EDR27372.1 hypothetical protein, conserved [Entamoeba dispar SAW760]|eukprot:EDR27372.1 hypothetical protein, conserved [Entamoeba dispar SAW760]
MEEDSKKKEQLKFPNFLQRYTTQYYVPNIDDHQYYDQYMFDHSNGLVIMGIAQCHPACKAKEISIQIVVDQGNNRPVKGKHKTNAIKLKSKTVIVKIIADNVEYPIYAGCSGKLIELNEELLKDPSLIKKESEGKGFIAIIQRSTTGKVDEIKAMNLKDYCELRNIEVPKYIPLPVANEEYDIDDYS